MSDLIALLFTNPVAAFTGLGALLAAALALFFKVRSGGVKAERAKHDAAKVKAYEHNLEDIRRVNDARARANTGKLSDDDGFKRK